MKKFIAFINIMLFSVIIGGAVSYGASLNDTPINPSLCVAGAMAFQLALQPFVGHFNFLQGTLNVITLAGLGGPDGTEENIGGIVTTVYWCPKADISTFETAPNLLTGTTYGSLAVIADPHTFVATKRMWPIYSTEDQGEMKYTPQGDVDGMSSKGTLEIFYPGASDEINGFCRMIKNQQTIFWVPFVDDKVFQIGSEKFPAHVQCEFNTAKNSSGVRGTKLTISSAVELCPMRYDPALQLTPAP